MARKITLLVGALSFERKAGVPVLPSTVRRKCIASVVRRRKPDILLCAGDSVGSKKDLKWVAKRAASPCVSIVLEDQDCHGLWVIAPGFGAKSLGDQIFGRTSDVAGKGKRSQKLIRKFERALHGREFYIYGLKVLVLACGEINILKGRSHVTVRSMFCKDVLLESDIILNPTHDRMANCGTLKRKREFLSQAVNGRKRAYISASNWDSCPGRPSGAQHPSRTLHTFFVSGREISQQEIKHIECTQPRYEYRETQIEL